MMQKVIRDIDIKFLKTAGVAGKMGAQWLLVIVCLATATVLFGCSGEDARDSRTMGVAKSDEFSGLAVPDERRPNILFILVDDMGYSDLGAFGSEIATPNLDALADQGLVMTNFHVNTVCTPTRAMLLTGVDSHRAGIGTMAGSVFGRQIGAPGYETYLNDRVVTVASLLRASGYHTYIAGKWDLGGRNNDQLLPDKRGFEESFVLVEGSADHFEQRPAFPDFTEINYRENGEPFDLPEGFYSSEFYTDKMIGFIDKHAQDGKPFFAYLPYTAPHYPLQAPDEFIAKYTDVYEVGYDAIRNRRIERMHSLGILPEDWQPADQHPVWPEWSELTEDVKALEVRRMQVYAAMVDAMDYHLGRLIKHMKTIGVMDNTLVIFMSDNGAEGGNPLDWEKSWFKWAETTHDMSLKNMGKRNSYVWYGPGWAHVSSTPFRLYKGFTTEGGLVSPTIISYPGVVEPGTMSHAYATALDFTPTILEIAGVEHPGTKYQGRNIFPLQGASMLDLISGKSDSVHGDNYVMGWEIFDRRAIHKGDWKIVWINKPWGRGAGNWSLFNMKDDPTELNDLADKNPDKLMEMVAHWDEYVKKNGVVAIDGLRVGWTNETSHYVWKPSDKE